MSQGGKKLNMQRIMSNNVLKSNGKKSDKAGDIDDLPLNDQSHNENASPIEMGDITMNVE